VSVAGGFREALEGVSGTVGDVIIIAVILAVIGFLLTIVTDVKNLLNALTGGGAPIASVGGNVSTVGLQTTGGIPITGFLTQGISSVTGTNPSTGGGLQ